MSLRDFCRKPVLKISPESTVLEACAILKRANVGCLIVERDGKLHGILTDRDIALKVAGERRDPAATTVAEVMTPDPVRISVERDPRHLTTLMRAYHVRRIPIVDGFDTILGIATLDDVLGILGGELSEIGEAVSGELPGGGE
ncbi:MAG TPA: CBS domain-containing protein [candidate division Zixibacteria bacterium]|nr:CBS domain-containing protein [candidate division Zixibacteria bacterium]